MTLVSASTKIAMSVASVRNRDGGACRLEHGWPRRQLRVGDARIGEDLTALLGVGAVEPDDDRRPQLDSAHRLDDALGDLLAARDPAEDVDEDRLDALVEVDHLE